MHFTDGATDLDSLSYSATGLPTGLVINPTSGLISGTIPADASGHGPYTVTVTASDGQGGTVSDTFVISASNQAPTVTAPTPAQAGVDGQPVVLDVAAAFADANGDPLTFAAAGLPPGLTINPTTGQIAGTIDHAASQAGPYTVTVTADDGKGGVATETFAWTVANPAPVVAAAIPDQGVIDGAAFALNITPSFKDGGSDTDTLTFSATGLPAGLSINPTTGLISGTIPADASQTGPFIVTVTAGDGQGGIVATTFTITSVNDAPVVAAQTPAQADADGANVTLDVGAAFAEPNGDPLTFSATGLPPGLSLDPTTGVITGTIDHSASQAGPYTVAVTANDGKGGITTETFAWTITNPAPVVVAAVPDQSVVDNQAFMLDAASHFKDGGADTDTLTFSATGLPAGLGIDAATGMITGQIPASASVAGPYTVTVTASDGQGGTVSDTFTITSGNKPPVANPDTINVQQFDTVTFDPRGNDIDPEGAPLTIVSAKAANGSVIINADGTLTYTPTGTFSGSDTIAYTISDGHGGFATSTITIVVAQGSTFSGGAAPQLPALTSAESLGTQPTIAVEGIVLSTVKSFNPGSSLGSLDAGRIVVSCVNTAGSLGGTAELTPGAGPVGLVAHINGELRGSAQAGATRAQYDNGTWTPQGLTGFSLHSITGEHFSDRLTIGSHKLVIEFDGARAHVVPAVARADGREQGRDDGLDR